MKQIEAKFESSRYYLSQHYLGLSILTRDYSNKYYTAMFYEYTDKPLQNYIVPTLDVKLVHAYDIDAQPIIQNNVLTANSIYEGTITVPEFKIRLKILGKLMRVYIVG